MLFVSVDQAVQTGILRVLFSAVVLEYRFKFVWELIHLGFDIYILGRPHGLGIIKAHKRHRFEVLRLVDRNCRLMASEMDLTLHVVILVVYKLVKLNHMQIDTLLHLVLVILLSIRFKLFDDRLENLLFVSVDIEKLEVWILIRNLPWRELQRRH
jgi:hypothetical protein